MDLADGRMRDDWARHGCLMALLANAHRNPKHRRLPYKDSDFNPFAEKTKAAPAMISIDRLKEVFVPK